VVTGKPGEQPQQQLALINGNDVQQQKLAGINQRPNSPLFQAFSGCFQNYATVGPVLVIEQKVSNCRKKLGEISLSKDKDLSELQEAVEMLRILLEASPVGSPAICHGIVALAKEFVNALPVKELENLPRDIAQELLGVVFLMFEQTRLETKLGVLGGVTADTKVMPQVVALRELSTWSRALYSPAQ